MVPAGPSPESERQFRDCRRIMRVTHLGHSSWILWSPRNIFLDHFINKPHANLLSLYAEKRALPIMYPKSEWEQGVYDPGAFKLDHLESTKPILHKWISTFLTCHMQHFPLPACREKRTPQLTPNVNETKGCTNLGHSNWTICSPQNLYLSYRFPLY